MFKKRMTVRRRVWHAISVVVDITAVGIMFASSDKTGSTQIWYMVVAAVMFLGAFPGAMDSLVSPCTACGGEGEVAAGGWTLPFEANPCSHCNGTGIEPFGITKMHDGSW